MMRIVLTIFVLSALLTAGVYGENVYVQNGNFGVGAPASSSRAYIQSSDSLNTLLVENTGGGHPNARPALDVVMRAISESHNIAIFRNLNGEVMRVNSLGNIGIGTGTIPSARLDVKSDGYITTFRAVGGTNAIVNPVSDILRESSGSGAPIAVFRNLGGEVMRVNDYGNVGIGTGATAPSARLHISSSGDITTLRVYSAGAGGSEPALSVYRRTYGGGDGSVVADFSSFFGNILTIRDNGKVGIAMATPQYTLDVGGEARATAWRTTSDARLKNVFGGYKSELNSVVGLNPVNFEFKNEKGIKHVGFVAQDVQRVMPEAVSIDAKGYLSVDNQVITAALVNAVKEQQKQIETLTEEVQKKCK